MEQIYFVQVILADAKREQFTLCFQSYAEAVNIFDKWKEALKASEFLELEDKFGHAVCCAARDISALWLADQKRELALQAMIEINQAIAGNDKARQAANNSRLNAQRMLAPGA